MIEFNSDLLREKFTLRETGVRATTPPKPVYAMSNRMRVTLEGVDGETREIFCVRAHTMHLCVRFCARILDSFRRSGFLLARETPYDWDSAWKSVVSAYEETHNSERWCTIYIHGKPIFTAGRYHPFLDVVEKCDWENERSYDYALPMAEEAFQKTGKTIKLEYDGNVALVTDLKEFCGRCGIILRGADRTTTFSFSVEGRDEKPIHFAQCLMVSAAFLEGIQLSYMVGRNLAKIEKGLIEEKSGEEKKTRMAQSRLKDLSTEIANLETSFKVCYRPERPDFDAVIEDTERTTFQNL